LLAYPTLRKYNNFFNILNNKSNDVKCDPLLNVSTNKIDID